MKQKVKNIWSALKQSGSDFNDYNVLKLSAALAYYTVFALAPMLIVLISIVSFFYGKQAAHAKDQIYGQIKSVVGSDAATSIQEIISKASLSPSFTFASVIGVIALLFSATGVFAEIQSSINLIWNLKIKPKKSGILKMLKIRLVSFSLIISLGFIALVSLLVNYAVDALSKQLLRFLPKDTLYVSYIINVAITLIAISLLFAIIFKFLPDAELKWKDVRVGAVTTAILFMIGKFVISLYVNKSHPGTIFGAAGSMIVILLWMYYSSMILYFGAAFTKNYAQSIGRHIYPNDYAVFIEQVEVENKSSLQNQNAKQVKDNETGEVKPK